MLNKKLNFILLCFFLFQLALAVPTSMSSAPQQSAHTSDISTQTRILSNGLKVIVRPIHRAPVLVSYICYKVGAADEQEGRTGLAHMLEHMMFKGTKQYGPGKLSALIAQYGGMDNAFTTYDNTCYFEKIDASRLPLIFTLEADRMQNLILSEKDFEKERQVVMEERRMRIDDNPQVKAFEMFNVTAHPRFSYQHPSIGWMQDISQFTLKDLKRWYNNWYRPNNSVVVVVGDVQPQEVFNLAEKYFGKIPNNSEKVSAIQLMLPPIGNRHISINLPAKSSYIFMGYNVPNLKQANPQWEAYALEMIANILASGESSRLQKSIVRGQQIATAIDANYDFYNRYPGLFLITGIPAQGYSYKDLESAIFKQINRLKIEPVPAEELDRIKTQVIASKIYAKDSLVYQAMLLGSLESVGLSWDDDEKYVERIQQITPEQIQTVAKKYFLNDRLTIGELKPIDVANGKTTALSSMTLSGVKENVR